MRSSMLPRKFAGVVLAVFGVLGWPRRRRRRSIGTGLAALLTEQTPPPAGFERDRAAAEATFGTVAGLFAVELTSIPVASSSGGFAYRFSPTLGTMERATDSFGPFFTERAVRNGDRAAFAGADLPVCEFRNAPGGRPDFGHLPDQRRSLREPAAALQCRYALPHARRQDGHRIRKLRSDRSARCRGRGSHHQPELLRPACEYVPRGVGAPVEPVGFGKRIWGYRRECAVPPDGPHRKRRGGWQRSAASHRPGRGPARRRKDSLATAGHRVMGKGPRRRGRERGYSAWVEYLANSSGQERSRSSRALA